VKPCECSDCVRLRATQSKVPEHLREGLLRYFVHHGGTGGFLEACLMNDLARAVAGADRDSFASLREIMSWIYNEAEPGSAWGSRKAVVDWLAKKPVTA
jgi:hypothetical protein